MDGEQLSGPSTRVRNATSLRTTAIKRDSLMAELERGESSGLSFRNSKRIASYSVSQPDAESLYQTPNIQLQSGNNAPKLSPRNWRTRLLNGNLQHLQRLRTTWRRNCGRKMLLLTDWKRIDAGLQREKRRNGRRRNGKGLSGMKRR
jgi:hypothetical protein